MGPTRHVLFLSRPDDNHLYRTLAVAEELSRRGHLVTFATSDPFAEQDADSGVLLLRYGRDVRALLGLPVFADRLLANPVDLIVADARVGDVADEIGREWGVRVLVAHTGAAGASNLDGVFVQPAARGTVYRDWQPDPAGLVLAVALDRLPLNRLAAAFGSGWRVLLLGSDLDAEVLPANFTALPASYSVLEDADIVLCGDDQDVVAAALSHAVPLVLAPRTPMARREADRLVAQGVGVVVDLEALDPERLRSTVLRFAVDEVAAAAARAARARLRESGTPGRVSDAIESTLAEDDQQAA